MKQITTDELLSKDRLDKVQSQKAAALFRYRTAYKTYSIPQDWPVPQAVPLLLDDLTVHVDAAGQATGFPAFLRTCPESPRHGVLESIKCNNDAELRKEFTRLRNIMKKEDPNGCLMLMPFVPANNSAVVALSHDDFTGYATFGAGHDGVTAGHGLQLSMPLRRAKHSDNIAMVALGCDPMTHELEFVFETKTSSDIERRVLDIENADKGWLTQIRGCPEHTQVAPPPEGVDVIGMVQQGEVVVKEFIVMSGLEEVAWLEENITKEKCPDGFMVVEPNGSRLSHIYAHCRGVGVPYVITESVNVGDRWVEPAMGWAVLDNEHKFTPKPYNPHAFSEDFIRGLHDANLYWAKQHGWLSTFFHQYVSVPYSDVKHTAYLAGVFVGWLPKSMMALGLGEMRHAKSLKQNAIAPLFATMTACIGSDVWKLVNSTPYLDSTRAHYYAAVGHIAPTYHQMAKMMTYLAKHFSDGWSKAFGGLNWAQSMTKGAALAKAVHDYISEPTQEHFDVVVQAANTAENAVHNNGKLFNKWLSGKALDAGTAGFNLRGDFKNMSAIYAMASELILNDNDERVCAVSPQNDWDEILDFSIKKTPAWWRKNPIAHSKNVLPILQETAKSMPAGFRHGERGSFNSPYNAKFIMCGVETCGTCANYTAWVANLPEAEKPEEVHSNIFEGAETIMLTPIKLDVWLVGDVVETRASVKQQIALIKAKEFMPNAEEFKKLYAALDVNDLDYAEMVGVLNKYLAKQDDKEAFISALLGKETKEESQ